MRESQVVSKWRAEGQAEGESKAMRSALLRLLRVRFPVELPGDLVAKVEAMTDLDELNRWFDAALTATTLEEFRAAVRSLS